MKEDDLQYCESVPGFFQKEQGLYLYNIIQNQLAKNDTIIEIGCYLGRSTCFIAQGIKDSFKNIRFITIDPFNCQGMTIQDVYQYSKFLDNTEPYRGLFEVRRNFSYKEIRALKDQKIGLLFIDGDHHYEAVKQDLENYLPLVKRLRLVCMHDYYNKGNHKRVKDAVDEFIAAGRLKPIEMIGNMIVLRKIR